MSPDHEIVELMLRQGGSFVKALAHAWLCADPENRMKIRTTWDDYFHKYALQLHETATDSKNT